MKDELLKTREYLLYLEIHYMNVQKAWRILQKECKNMSFISDDYRFHCIDIDIKFHDESKLSKEEFVPYRRKFFPTDFESKSFKESIDFEFNKAWEHHKLNNRHHWENWTQEESVPYPEIDLVHNICDWMAMGMKFNDTAKSYYEKNKDKINIPDWAERLMYEIFDKIRQ